MKLEELIEPCPKCGGKVQIRKTKKRRNYYICENNPNNGCDYISWTKPVKEKKETRPKKTIQSKRRKYEDDEDYKEYTVSNKQNKDRDLLALWNS